MSKIDAIGQAWRSKFGTMTDPIVDEGIDASSLVSTLIDTGIGAIKDIGSVAGISAGGAAIGATTGVFGAAMARDRNIRYGRDSTGVDDAFVQGAWSGGMAGLGVGLAWRGGRRLFQGISWIGKKVDKRAGEEFTSSIGEQ